MKIDRQLPEETGDPLQSERRSEFRNRNAFKICTVEYFGQTYLSVLRNISASGAQIELFPELDIAVDDIIVYSLDEIERIHGEVIWRSDSLIGVRNVSVAGAGENSFPSRSIRAACALPCTVRCGSEEHEAVIVNVSLTGVLVAGLRPQTSGVLATITVQGLSLCNVSSRWSGEGVVGFKFERPLRIAELAQLFGNAM